jgi:hypothetical protein
MRTDLDEVGSKYSTSKTVPPHQDSGMRAIHPIVRGDDVQNPINVPVELEKPPPQAMQGAPSLTSDDMEANDLWGKPDKVISRPEDEQGGIFQGLGEIIRQIVAIIIGDRGR